MYSFHCTFEYRHEKKTVIVNTLADVKDGFWINENYEFTKGSDSIVWIAPARILHVLKV